jgi:hypothetical protein
MGRVILVAAVVAIVGALAAGCASVGGPVLRPPPEVPPAATLEEATARLEKALEKDGITLGDVATFIFQYGFEVVPLGGAWKGWHWKASTEPLSYYVATIRVAVEDTLLPVYFRNGTAGPYSVQVEGIFELPDGTYLRSLKSDLGWSSGDGTHALPGVDPSKSR